MRMKLTLCALSLAMTACMGDDVPPSTAPGIDETVVFEPGPHLAQCAPPALTRAQSAAKLTGAGIDVRRSSCGYIENVAYPAVCGAGTGEILLHDIPVSSLADAQAAGFASTDTLEKWRRDSCAHYLHAIEVAQGTTSCVDQRNRVLVIRNEQNPDDRMTLLDQAGTCADASYRQVLFGDEGDNELCSAMDSIAGPQKSCPDSARAAMFDTMLQNLDQQDLGLGAGYTVGQVYPIY